MEAEEPTILEDGNQATVNGPYRITVLVRTRLRQRNCRESMSSEFGDSELGLQELLGSEEL
jgi:hypothetical protein